MTPGRVQPLARVCVGLAVRTLPRAARARYRSEFHAELARLAPGAQLDHAVRLLSRAPALRAALEEAAMPDPARSGPLVRCRVLRWHDFVVRSTSDGGRYQVCRRCGTDRGPVGYGPLSTPPYPVGSAGA